MNKEDGLMVYVAKFPNTKGYGAIAVDRPEYKKDIAKDISDWIKRGATVLHVSLEEGQNGFCEYEELKQ